MRHMRQTRQMLAASVVVATALAFSFPVGAEGGGTRPLLQAMEANRVKGPKAEPSERYPEKLAMLLADGSEYSWGHARAYIHAPVEQVWSLFKRPTTVLDVREIDSQVVTRRKVPGDEFGFLADFEVDQLLFDIKWRERWRYGALPGGAPGRPGRLVRFAKISGTRFISLMEGAFIVREANARTTEVEMVFHLDATNSGKDTIRTYFNYVFAQLIKARKKPASSSGPQDSR